MDQREDRSIDREEAGRYGEREAWIRERIGATGRVRSEPIARKQVDTANAGVDQREDRSHV